MAINSLFKEILTERPSEVYEDTEVNALTQNLLNAWFYYREVCSSDDDKFLHFWHRNLNDYYNSYLLKLELELSNLPDFTNYAEALHEVIKDSGTSSDAHTGTQTKSKTGTDTDNKTGTEVLDKTGTDTTDDTGTDTMNNSGTDTLNNTGTDTTTNTGTQTNAQTIESSHREVALQTPQSQSYSTIPGEMPNLEWQYITGQNETRDNGGTTQRTDNLTALQTLNTENKETIDTENRRTLDLTKTETLDLNDTTTFDVQNQTTYDSSDETTYNDTKLKTNDLRHTTDMQISGRTELETEIREKISKYINKSFALDWFKEKLEICFFGIYREED